jgi:Rieske Fe-S protein
VTRDRPRRRVEVPLVADEEQWRRDFPYTSVGEELVTRRDFTRYLAAASGAFAVGTVGVAVFAATRDTVTADPRPIVALASVPVGTSYLFRYPTGGDPAILLHLPDGALRAYSQKCTHLGCVVMWLPGHDDLLCPCHEGHFDLRTGEPIAGPPDWPLPAIDLEVRGDTVWALGTST